MKHDKNPKTFECTCLNHSEIGETSIIHEQQDHRCRADGTGRVCHECHVINILTQDKCREHMDPDEMLAFASAFHRIEIYRRTGYMRGPLMRDIWHIVRGPASTTLERHRDENRKWNKELRKLEKLYGNCGNEPNDGAASKQATSKQGSSEEAS